uniref:PAS domain-containing protein n=1 Tax=Angiostrongylus cantonensis TaxID=6313 RepID=A0A0K0DDM1_ANGCA
MDSSDTRKRANIENFRNMERRRETSRYAARDRRGKETEIFSDLRAVVPIVGAGTVTHLDRIAILRVGSAWCRLRKIAPNVGPELTKVGRNLWCEDTITECLDGFIIIADSEATILCVTESVCLYLGLSQTDLIGRSFREFLHPSDYTEYMELTNRLGSVLVECQDISKSPEYGIYAELRMKTVITQRGRNLNLKSALYKSVSFILRAERALCGHVVRLLATSDPAGQGSANVHATTLTKVNTLTGSFMTRHTSDMRISYVHDRLNYILRNELKSLIGTNFFELIDPNDLPSFRESMVMLFAKGHARTLLYRLLASNNRVVWVTTDASIVNHTSKGQRSQYVICIHHIAGIKEMAEKGRISKRSCAGCTMQIKKEIDDTRDYAGRQPHVDATGTMDFQMQPLTGREDFSMMTRLLSFTDSGTVNDTSIDVNPYRYFNTVQAIQHRFTVHGASLHVANDGAIEEATRHKCQCLLRGKRRSRERATSDLSMDSQPSLKKQRCSVSRERTCTDSETENMEIDEVLSSCRTSFSLFLRIPFAFSTTSVIRSGEKSNQSYPQAFFRGQSQCAEHYFGQVQDI